MQALILSAVLMGCAAKYVPPPVCKRNPERLDIYQIAELVTGTPASIIYGIGYAETRGVKNRDKCKAGIGGHDRGRFGLRETKAIRRYRVAKYGRYDPHNPSEAAIIVGKILRDNLRYYEAERKTVVRKLHRIGIEQYGEPMDKAISAYNQGINGNKKWGINQRYVDTVIEGARQYGR